MLKSFDFFKKIQTDQQLTSATGGIYTIVSLVAAAFLIFYSISDFNRVRYYTFLAVQNDDSEYLPMNIDILFNRMPCNAIAIEFYDEMEYSESDLENKLTLYSIPRGAETGTVYKRDKDFDRERDLLKNNIQQGYQCRIKGTLPLPKTPGTLVFKPTAQNNLIMSLDDEIMDKSRMSYRIDTLYFGNNSGIIDFPIAHKSKNIENYINQLQGDIKTRKYVQNFEQSSVKQDYFNHLKIIPVIIQDYNNIKNQSNYRYSLRSGTAQLQGDPFEGVMFMTEIEPINIIYKSYNPKFYHMIIEILAIVGGTVATIGILNTFSHFIFGIK